jgi:hypothetical protein
VQHLLNHLLQILVCGKMHVHVDVSLVFKEDIVEGEMGPKQPEEWAEIVPAIYKLTGQWRGSTRGHKAACKSIRLGYI